jgi:glutathione-specific gamma-glutamylcyclotransferase
MTLTRAELIADTARKALRKGELASRLWDDAQLETSRRGALAKWDGRRSLWVFGYGSLVWNPQLEFSARIVGQVFGYHRALCLWSRINRGTPQRPGLVFGLKRGGSCKGVAYEIRAQNVEHETELLWRREMLMGSYIPTWMQFRGDDGKTRDVLTFCVDPSGAGYAGQCCEQEMLAALCAAKGRYGTCMSYVTETLAALRAHGIDDRALARLVLQAQRQMP